VSLKQQRDNIISEYENQRLIVRNGFIMLKLESYF